MNENNTCLFRPENQILYFQEILPNFIFLYKIEQDILDIQYATENITRQDDWK